MMLFKNCLLILILSWVLASSAKAQVYIFDDVDFWTKYPVNHGANEAWQNGVKWPLRSVSVGYETVIVYYKSYIFGFTERKIPNEADPGVRAQIIKNYIIRTEAQAIHRTGIFAFNNFDCTAKANFDIIRPKLDTCSKIKIYNKISSDWKNKAFSIIQMSIDEICSCRKELDKAEGINNYDIFFAPIARYEVDDLNSQNKQDEMIDFFIKHYKKDIFSKKQFLTTLDYLISKKKYNEATYLLDFTVNKYNENLNSLEWERCGDFYYQINDKDKAEEAYIKASERLNN
jgi:tetratricopeptide (TPR) repeat protein